MSGLGQVGKAVVGIGAPALAGWLGMQSYKGAREEWEHHHQQWREHQQMDQLRYNWGMFSGQPKMDTWAQKLKKMLLYGPWGIGITINKVKSYVGGFFNDVILNNILPIGIGAAAFGTVFHKEIGRAGKSFKQRLLSPLWRELRPHINGQWTRKMLGKMADGFVWGVRKLFRNPAVMLGAIPIIGILGFGAHRFNNVYSGEEQNQFLGDYLDKPHH